MAGATQPDPDLSNPDAWEPGEVVVDPYALTVQDGAPPGTYVIEVGMYDPATVQRLPVLDPAGEMGDRVLLGNVVIGVPTEGRTGNWGIGD